MRSLPAGATGHAVHRVLPAGVCVVTVLLVLHATQGAAATTAGVLIAVGHGSALWWRRRAPVLVLAAALAGSLVIHWIAPEGLFPYAALVALGSVAAAREPRWSLPALAAVLALTALNYVSAVHPRADVDFAMLLPIVVWAFGEAARQRRRAFEEATRRAVADEQARISRELHDVLAHSVSGIVVQAAAVQDACDVRPAAAREALEGIEGSARRALGELRQLLDGVQDPLQRPDLERLTVPLRASGVDVVVRGGERLGDLDEDVQLVVHRVVQEALTNVLRHASARHVQVAVERSAGRLVVEVCDDGAGSPPAHGVRLGRGLAGMRERVALVGGDLDAGPLKDSGFRVLVSIPLGRR